MYMTILLLHSWLRWVALVAGVAATIAALRGNTAPPAASRADRWGLILLITLDSQLLLGMLMYLAVSPTMTSIRENFGASMKDPAARFWAVEHITMMLGAVIATHVGRILARKSATADAKRMTLFICFAIATALMLLAIPWPGLRAGRPLFRLP
jgi:cytochrome c biogenesis factor